MKEIFSRRYSGRVDRPLMPFERLNVMEDKKTKKKSACISLHLPTRDDDSRTVAELDVDQFSGQDFMQNANGFITNDIMVFEQCQSDSVARAVLNRLKVLHPESLPQDMTVDQMMNSIIPANYGSPSEFVSAHKNIATRVYKLHEAEVVAYNKKMAAEAAVKMSKETQDLSDSVPKPE